MNRLENRVISRELREVPLARKIPTMVREEFCDQVVSGATVMGFIAEQLIKRLRQPMEYSQRERCQRGTDENRILYRARNR